ncbi:Ras-related protein Rab3 [Acrasis kona]|uniref:Ras-related protein Rab3 n=1 Tax=Acrasis kona TaxID=1008807 RepID=A0AAW2ZAP5_9EUKA
MNRGLKVLVLGDSNVGKTSIIRRLDKNEFVENYFRTQGPKTTAIHHNKTEINFVDVPKEQVSGNHLQSSRCVLIVYDITNASTFANVGNWWNMIVDYNHDANIIIVGNKSDMSGMQSVPSEVGRKKATNYGIPFFEISCKNNSQIAAVLDKIVQMSTVVSIPLEVTVPFKVHRNIDIIPFWRSTLSFLTCNAVVSNDVKYTPLLSDDGEDQNNIPMQ